jgi:hypothetical protein
MRRVNWNLVWVALLVLGLCALLYFQAAGWPLARIPSYIPRGLVPTAP